jgi:GDPmannose 4,6-dehydratase
MKRALITGITGQDGSYLAEFLLKKGSEVHGLVRSSSSLGHIAGIQTSISLHTGSLDDRLSLENAVKNSNPDECYHFAGSSFYKYSFDQESTVLKNNFESTHSLLGAIKERKADCRFFFAGSAEMFGVPDTSPQNEETPFSPHSIYSVAKLASHHMIRYYRDNHAIFGCTGILFNHESPRRGTEFVTRKITSTVAKIKQGREKKLVLGNLETVRDWGYAPDFVEAAWLMVQQDQADDFVLATGVPHTVREFVDCAFRCVDLDYRSYIDFDPSFFRDTEKVPRVGDSTKARKRLNWAPKMSFEAMVSEMVAADLKSS